MSREIIHGRSPQEIQDDYVILLVEEFGQNLDELLTLGWDALRNRHYRLQAEQWKKEDRAYYGRKRMLS